MLCHGGFHVVLFLHLNQMIHEPTGHIMTVKVHHTHCKLVWIIDICSCFFLMSVTRKQESLTSFCLLYNQIWDVSSTNEREMLLNALNGFVVRKIDCPHIVTIYGVMANEVC